MNNSGIHIQKIMVVVVDIVIRNVFVSGKPPMEDTHCSGLCRTFLFLCVYLMGMTIVANVLSLIPHSRLYPE